MYADFKSDSCCASPAMIARMPTPTGVDVSRLEAGAEHARVPTRLAHVLEVSGVVQPFDLIRDAQRSRWAIGEDWESSSRRLL